MWLFKKKSRIVGMISIMLVVCTAAWYGLSYGNSLKAAISNYIKGDPSEGSTLSTLEITSGGNTSVGSAGTLATPVCKEVPPCGDIELGEDAGAEKVIKMNGKGGERNPFVILEIVPDEAMQQLTLLNSSNPNYCVDWLNIGVKSGRKFVNMSQQDLFNMLGFSNTYGYWVDTFDYNVLKFGTDEDNPEYEKKRFIQAGVVYNISVKKDDIIDAGYNFDDFMADAQAKKDMVTMQNKYPKIFKKATADKKATDEEGTYKKKGIRDIAIKDEQNWVKSNNLSTVEYTVNCKSTDLTLTNPENFVAGDAVKNNQTFFENKTNDDAAAKDYDSWTVKTTDVKTENSLVKADAGYYYYATANNGNCNLEFDYSTGSGKFVQKDANGNGQWFFVKSLTELPAGRVESGSFNPWWQSDGDKAGAYWSTQTIKSGAGSDVYKLFSGKVYSYEFKYKKLPADLDPTFTFKYWNIKDDDVLKRSLFIFNNQEEADNFNLQVICMTPSQINEIYRNGGTGDPNNGDTADTIDMIERADLFYISTIDKTISNYDKVVKFYNENVNKGAAVDANNMKNFSKDDLEWDLCMKILKRCSDNPNLALMYNKPVGFLLDTYANESIDMYVGTHSNGDTKSYTSTINNIGKMYLLSLQFDLQAGTQASESKIDYKQTLFGDNGLANRIHTVELSKEVTDTMAPNSAKYTGYFEPAIIKNEKSKYLWNRYTFYPADVKNGSSVDKYMEYGYLKSYLKTYPFEKDNDTNESKYEHLEGTDGDSDDNNVTVVRSGSLADTNRSTMISLTEGSDIVNKMMEILYKIMHNGKDPQAGPLSLNVRSQKRYYTRISDSNVLLDYSLDARYPGADTKTLYLKVSIANPVGALANLEPGALNSVYLKNEDGSKINVDIYDTIGGPALEKVDIYDEIFDAVDKTHYLHGYKVPLENPLVVYVPFTLKQWQDGYNTVVFKMQGMTYNKKKKVSVVGTETTEEVEIDEKPLFKLE